MHQYPAHPATGNILSSCIRHPVWLPWRCTRSEGPGGGEDGRRVGDTGCDEAVDLICSPAPSSSSPASVTCVLSYLLHLFSFLSSAFLLTSLYCFPLTSFLGYFQILQTLPGMCTFTVWLLTILLILSSLLFLFCLLLGFNSPSHHPHTTSQTFHFSWVFLANTFPTLSLHIHKHLTPSSSASLPPLPPPPPPPSLAHSISVLCSKTGALRQQEMGTRDNRMEGSIEGSL